MSSLLLQNRVTTAAVAKNFTGAAVYFKSHFEKVETENKLDLANPSLGTYHVFEYIRNTK